MNLFEKFRDVKTREEQAINMELAEHATRVMTTLDDGIKGLDDLDSFFEYLHQVGASHRKVPGFKVEYFWVRKLLRCCAVIVGGCCGLLLNFIYVDACGNNEYIRGY